MLTPKYITRADVKKIEEALDTADLEMMVAAVDRIVSLRLKAERDAQSEQERVHHDRRILQPR